MATITASGVTVAAVQAAVNSATDGDTVIVPAGAATWGSPVLITKGITLQGAGVGQTVITNTAAQGQFTSLAITLNAVATFKMTGFDFQGQNAFNIDGTPTTKPFWIEHCNFDFGSGNAVFCWINGNPYGVINSCTWTSGGGSEMIHNMGYGSSSGQGWVDDCVPGSINMVVIEDCTFTKNPYVDDYFWGTAVLESYYGARTVLRHCTLNYVDIDQHGTAGNIGTRWWEFYENTFTLPATGLTGDPNQSAYIVCRAGSGVIWNNHKTGGNNVGGGGIKFYEEDTGAYPQLYQVGRGINQTASPAYTWGNDVSIFVSTDATLVQMGRDVFDSPTQPPTLKRSQISGDTGSTTYVYVPLAYPHPLRAANPVTPLPPNPPSTPGSGYGNNPFLPVSFPKGPPTAKILEDGPGAYVDKTGKKIIYNGQNQTTMINTAFPMPPVEDGPGAAVGMSKIP